MIVGLTGLKGSGKDTVADYLVREHEFTKIGFATALKASVAALHEITLEQIEQWKNDTVRVVILRTYEQHGGKFQVQEASHTFREYLQRYGTEAHRDVFGPDFWIDSLITRLYSKGGGNYVVPDVRFDNEALSLIAKRNGLVYQVVRPGIEQDSHTSEDGINHEWITDWIPNDGTIEELYEQVRTVIGL